jgi:hypothetical protein
MGGETKPYIASDTRLFLIAKVLKLLVVILFYVTLSETHLSVTIIPHLSFSQSPLLIFFT